MQPNNPAENKKPVSADLYNGDYYKKLNHGFAVFKNSGDIMPELKKHLGKINFENKAVLDIGCGRGEAVIYASNAGAAKVTGIDYSKASIEISNKFLTDNKKNNGSRVEFIQMDAKELKFPNDSFDIVLMLDVVEHLHAWELKQSLQEVKRVLKPEGLLYIHTSPNKIVMTIVRTIAKFFGVTLKSDEFHVNEQSYFTLKKYTKNFTGQIILEKDCQYWYNQMESRGALLKNFALFLDLVIDNRIMHTIMSTFPLSILFSSDLWFIGKKN